MNLAEKMLAITREVNNREKLDILFNELVLPQITREANNKKRETSFSSFGTGQSNEDKRVQSLFPKVRRLQDIVGGEMKPYLEELGFRVILCSPAYYTYIRW